MLEFPDTVTEMVNEIIDNGVARRVVCPYVQKAFDTGKWPKEPEIHVASKYLRVKVYDIDRYLQVDLLVGSGTENDIVVNMFDGRTTLMYAWLKQSHVSDQIVYKTDET
ncbi:MAG: hypothetical protein KAS32_03430 [Candidatus Peribacteraceae bacterium]|nr:hypothetical protein [Candidatus Peribacteraceae bacterium]